MTCEGEWYTKGSFVPIKYKDLWQKCIRNGSQGLNVLAWTKVKHGQCEQMFALLGPKL